MDTYENFLNRMRGAADKMLCGTVKTSQGETVRVDPEQVRQRFVECVDAFLVAWRRWHGSHNTEEQVPGANPIDWPSDRTRTFAEIRDACMYTTLAVIHDSLANPIGPNGCVIDSATKEWAGLKVSMFECIRTRDRQAGYTREEIVSCLRYVGDDLAERYRAPSPTEPSKEANQAYLLYTSMGISQKDVAAKMSEALRRPIQQWKISRWINAVRKYRKATGLPVDDPGQASRIVPVDPSALERGRRTDGKTPRKNKP